MRFSLPVMPAVSALITFTRCELKSPDASLFEVPADYTRDAFQYFGERMAAKARRRKTSRERGRSPSPTPA